jgi:hypothetical protein
VNWATACAAGDGAPTRGCSYGSEATRGTIAIVSDDPRARTDGSGPRTAHPQQVVFWPARRHIGHSHGAPGWQQQHAAADAEDRRAEAGRMNPLAWAASWNMATTTRQRRTARIASRQASGGPGALRWKKPRNCRVSGCSRVPARRSMDAIVWAACRQRTGGRETYSPYRVIYAAAPREADVPSRVTARPSRKDARRERQTATSTPRL